MKVLVQSGWNYEFPMKIITWKLGEEVPEWLSDLAKVKEITDQGKIILETRNLQSGGFEIVNASGNGVLVKVIERDGLVAKDLYSDKVFSLTLDQLDLLYCEEE